MDKRMITQTTPHDNPGTVSDAKHIREIRMGHPKLGRLIHVGYHINYSNTTKNSTLFIDVSASRRKPLSGLTSGAGRQYVKACLIRPAPEVSANEGFRREAETSINTMLFLVVLE